MVHGASKLFTVFGVRPYVFGEIHNGLKYIWMSGTISE
jgi:hypothetical protein